MSPTQSVIVFPRPVTEAGEVSTMVRSDVWRRCWAQVAWNIEYDKIGRRIMVRSELSACWGWIAILCLVAAMAFTAVVDGDDAAGPDAVSKLVGQNFDEAGELAGLLFILAAATGG